MQERVALLGGAFHVESHPGAGTLITVEVAPTQPPAGDQPSEERLMQSSANLIRSEFREESQA